MSSRVLASALVAGCVTAAAGGAYVATRQNEARPVPVAAAPAGPVDTAAQPIAGKPVSETETVIGGSAAKPQPEAVPSTPVAPAPAGTAAPVREAPRSIAPTVHREPAAATAVRNRPIEKPVPAPQPAPAVLTPERPAAPAPATSVEPTTEAQRPPEPAPAPPAPRFEEVVLPASSVIGLQVDTPLSSERSRIEDRVEARVTRDVLADGRVAIPAGSRVIGSVTLVERGGKVKQPARLGVRFHTLVLADGREIPLGTEPVYREGESPAGESARKIGGAAIGGAILGAIIGGGKGAVIGGATGAAGGSAVVMAGDRNAATLAPGTVVTVRLSAPATIDVEKRDQQFRP
jgi:hypothetical protein